MPLKMNRRNFLHLTISTTTLGYIAPAFAKVSAQKKPNIVIILADDLGWHDVGYHGSDIRTPHINRLAEEGVELDRLYTCPVCSPSNDNVKGNNRPIISESILRTIELRP
ncbi:MAG: sulfatase-like hydrolase/transferase [Phycisphaerae bacterium]